MPQRILITGFGPFPGIIENASAHVAPLLAERAGRELPGTKVAAAVLPTEWEAGPRDLEKLITDFQPSVCLHLGVSGWATGVVQETHARNRAAERPDAAGRVPTSRRLIEDAPALLVPARTSQVLALGGPGQSGDYVCNAVFFHSLWLARQQAGRRHVAFLHLPVRVGDFGMAQDRLLNRRPLPLESALEAALKVLTAIAQAATPGRTAPARS